MTRSALVRARAAALGVLFAVAVAALAACSGAAGSGTVQVFVEAEDTIPGGLDPGPGPENVVDGWTVRYSKFVVVVGKFHAWRSADPTDRLDGSNVLVADLTKVPTSGLVLEKFEGATATRFDKVGFDLLRAESDATRADGTDQQDFDELVKKHWSIHVVGTIAKDSNTITFDFGLDAATSFDDCAPDQGDVGFAVPTGGAVQVKPTIHGDHWFFSSITQGIEITKRRAQWLADSDVDGDGKVDMNELAGVRAADVFPASEYNLSGAIIPIISAADFVEAQARTLGDYNGEGECPTRKKL